MDGCAGGFADGLAGDDLPVELPVDLPADGVAADDVGLSDVVLAVSPAEELSALVGDELDVADEREAPAEPDPPEPQPARSSVIPTPVAVRAVPTDVRFIGSSLLTVDHSPTGLSYG